MTMFIVSWTGLPRHFLKKKGGMNLDHGILKDEYIVIEDINICVLAPDKTNALLNAIQHFCNLDENEDYLLSKNIDTTLEILKKMNPTVTALNDGVVFQFKEASSIMYKGFNIE